MSYWTIPVIFWVTELPGTKKPEFLVHVPFFWLNTPTLCLLANNPSRKHQLEHPTRYLPWCANHVDHPRQFLNMFFRVNMGIYLPPQTTFSLFEQLLPCVASLAYHPSSKQMLPPSSTWLPRPIIFPLSQYIPILSPLVNSSTFSHLPNETWHLSIHHFDGFSQTELK